MIKMDAQEIKDIIRHSMEVEQTYNVLHQYYQKYREAYFMEPPAKPKNSEVDAADWKITPSPSARNEVQGVTRLLNTSEIGITMREGDVSSPASDRIERGLKKIMEVSGEGRRARLLSDATLSASLFGPVILTADFYADRLAAKNLPDYTRRHLEKQAYKVPAKIKVLNPEECSMEQEDGITTLHQHKYKVRGSTIKTRWGGIEGKPIKDNMEYTVRDIYTPEYRVIEVEGYGTVLAMAHGLNCIPVGVGYSGGSELFFKREEQVNPLLFGKMRAELWERETAAYTAIFTSMSKRGLLGPLFHIEGNPEQIHIQHKGGARFITTDGGGAAKMIDDKVIDPVVFEVLGLLDNLSGQSTIFKQTLGENIKTSTFSALAMLSSSGKLPLVDPERALQQAFSEIFDYILYRIKADGIENPVISPSDIPEHYEVEVTFKPKLPQDDLRNAQVAAQIQGLVSEEWIQQNLLQIGDSAAMRKEIFKERAYAAMQQALLQDPNFLQSMIAQVTGAPPPQATPPEIQPETPPGMEDVPPFEGGEGGFMPTPQQGPMIPPQERGIA